jgi:ankyrin repeat protein
MNSCLRWWETEWFENWQRLALHQAVRMEPGPARKLESPVPTAPAEAVGDSVGAELLLADGAEVNAKNNIGETPLHLAVSDGKKDVAELLLANKAEVDAKDNNGWTPLHWAAIYDHKDVAELLLANKAEVNAKDNNGWTPLHWAAGKGRKDVAELLRQHGGHE